MSIRVLIADDSPVVRTALELHVEAHPLLEAVGSAEDADEAAALAARTHPDVALIDVHMPGGGECAIRRIVEQSPQTKVVVLSAAVDQETSLRMIRAGASSYLVKTDPANDIVAAVVRAARGESIFGSAVAADVVGRLSAHLRRGHDERLEDRISRAIREREFESLFQPIVHLPSRRIEGYEALTRFEPGSSPQRWFEDAELVDLRSALELAAITAAADRFRSRHADGFLSVNASPELLPALEALASELGPRLVVELTEHAAVDDYAEVAGDVERLRAAGARLAVDDAGAGFASFRHVLELQPDLVKLDMSLTRGIDGDARRRAFARGLAAIADELGMMVIAEGVETDAELRVLDGLGISLAQGYLLGAPS